MDENKEVNSTDPKREKVRVIPLSAIDDAPDHPFGVRDDEEMAELVESISTFGVINPVIVRKGEGERYELISGHRRKYACAKLGIDTLPVIVRDLSREEAIIFMVDSNLQREHILPSERANDKLPHTFDQKNTDAKHLKSKATCTAKAVYYYSCTCGENGTETFETGDVLGHDYGTKWSSDSKEHWHECSRCGDRKDNAAHNPGAEPTEKTAQTCTICGYVIKPALGHKHNFGSDWQWNGTMHWHSCSGCSDHSDESRHVYDNACDTTCNVCGYERKVEHKYDEKWKTDESKHWHECSVCGAKKDEAAHTPGAEPTETSAQTCTVCGYVIKNALGHTHKFASDWSSDEKNHWHECSCGEKADVSAHNPGDWIIDREVSEGVEGAKHKECTECKRTVETEAIPALPVATTTTSAAATTVTTTTAAQTTTGKPAGRGCRLTVGTGATFAIVSILGMGLVLSKRKTK